MRAFPTAEGDTVWWYESMRCVAWNGRLFFMADVCEYFLRYLIGRGARVMAETTIETDEAFLRARSAWPTADYWRYVHFHSGDGDAFSVGCHVVQERVALVSKGLFIDQIHPALRRLQRWFRAYSVRLRRDRRLAFAMAMHRRLGACSAASVLVLDAVDSVLRLV